MLKWSNLRTPSLNWTDPVPKLDRLVQIKIQLICVENCVMLFQNSLLK